MIPTQSTKMKVKAEETQDAIPAEMKLKVVEEADRVLVNGLFEENTIAQVLLVDAQGEMTRYVVNTAAQNFQAMCVGTFQKADAREVDTFINKNGLAGAYQVKLLVQVGEDEYKIYNTGVTIEA